MCMESFFLIFTFNFCCDLEVKPNGKCILDFHRTGFIPPAHGLKRITENSKLKLVTRSLYILILWLIICRIPPRKTLAHFKVDNVVEISPHDITWLLLPAIEPVYLSKAMLFTSNSVDNHNYTQRKCIGVCSKRQIMISRSQQKINAKFKKFPHTHFCSWLPCMKIRNKIWYWHFFSLFHILFPYF